MVSSGHTIMSLVVLAFVAWASVVNAMPTPTLTDCSEPSQDSDIGNCKTPKYPRTAADFEYSMSTGMLWFFAPNARGQFDFGALCSASIIAEDYIVTAAHCAVGDVSRPGGAG